MKYLKQLLIIILISFIGEVLNHLIPLPIPASIYGLIILFAGLETKIIPLASVRETGKFLVEIMPIMFIPPAVGVMESWGIIKASWVPYLVITVVTTVAVMAVSGRVTQAVMRKKRTREVTENE